MYDGIKFDEGLRLDVVVKDLICYELKAREEHIQFQPGSTNNMLFKINKETTRISFYFSVTPMKDGIKRIIL